MAVEMRAAVQKVVWPRSTPAGAYSKRSAVKHEKRCGVISITCYLLQIGESAWAVAYDYSLQTTSKRMASQYSGHLKEPSNTQLKLTKCQPLMTEELAYRYLRVCLARLCIKGKRYASRKDKADWQLLDAWSYNLGRQPDLFAIPNSRKTIEDCL